LDHTVGKAKPKNDCIFVAKMVRRLDLKLGRKTFLYLENFQKRQ